MKTFSAKPTDIKRQWHILDASEVALGRLATVAASLLIGKDKTVYSPHVDSGDFVVVINSDKLIATGEKTANKVYWRHSGFPGGLRARTLAEQLRRDSTKVILLAVKGMLPDNKLRQPRLRRLKVHSGSEHRHMGQNPQVYRLKKEEASSRGK